MKVQYSSQHAKPRQGVERGGSDCFSIFIFLHSCYKKECPSFRPSHRQPVVTCPNNPCFPCWYVRQCWSQEAAKPEQPVVQQLVAVGVGNLSPSSWILGCKFTLLRAVALQVTLRWLQLGSTIIVCLLICRACFGPFGALTGKARSPTSRMPCCSLLPCLWTSLEAWEPA